MTTPVDPTTIEPGSKDICPGCGVDLRHFVGGTQYSRLTSVEIRGVYDGGLFYSHVKQTGGCGLAWHRWGTGDEYAKRLHDKAQEYIDQWNERWFVVPGTIE